MPAEPSNEDGSQQILEANNILEEKIGSTALQALRILIDARVEARFKEFLAEAVVASERSPLALQSKWTSEDEGRDPFESLTAEEIAKLLGISKESVRQREASGELFSINRPARSRCREYPAFQAWDGIAGKPLRDILQILPSGSGAMAFGFFSGKTMDLEDCAPIEILLGRILDKRPLGRGAHRLLQASYYERLACVKGSAVAYRHQVMS